MKYIVCRQDASARLKQLDLRSLRIFLHLGRIRLGLIDQMIDPGAAINTFLNQDYIVNNEWINPVPVSYTHLDVYKRPGVDRLVRITDDIDGVVVAG